MSKSSPCTLTLPDGTFYDLSSLGSAKADYEVVAENTTYFLNVCRGVVGELYKVDDPENVGGYRKAQGAFGDFSLGIVVPFKPFTYRLGGHTLAAHAQFTCAPSEFSAGKPKLVAALPPGDPSNYCSFFFEWPTHVACPTNPKTALASGHYLTFGVLLLIAFLTWFIGQTLWNRFYLNRSGLDIFPIPSFSLPSRGGGSGSGSGGGGGWSLPKPNFPWSKGKSPARGYGWNRQRGYSNIRAEDHDEEEHFAGRFSLEDDEVEPDARSLGPGDIDGRAGGLGEETNAWRAERSNGVGETPGKVGVNQGLVDI